MCHAVVLKRGCGALLVNQDEGQARQWGALGKRRGREGERQRVDTEGFIMEQLRI